MACSKCLEMRQKMLKMLGFAKDQPHLPHDQTVDDAFVSIASGPAQAREVFGRFCHAATGFDSQYVVGAAIGVIVWALRLAYHDSKDASAKCDEIAGRMKELLLTNYNPSTGKLRKVIPQVGPGLVS